MRLFVALDLPWELKQRLAVLCGGITGARWVPVENFHLTLRFIGDADPVQAEEIDLALASVRAPRFPLDLTGIGTFGKADRVVTLWAGVARTEALEHLHGKIETALRRAGMEPERRRFIPHITLARLDQAAEAKVAAFIQAKNLFRAAPAVMDHFTLFSSHLHPDGAIYTPEAEYRLA